MDNIPDGSIDLVLCDLPYDKTIHAWDSIIPLESLWRHYKRVIKPNGAIILTACQPFTSMLVMSNLPHFRYEIIWEKTMPTMFQHANKMPMRKHENVLIFYSEQPTYNPQFEEGKPYTRAQGSGNRKASGFHTRPVEKAAINNKGTRYPTSIKKASNSNHGLLHPTQKPLELFEYLIRTYSNDGDTVLDNCMGSGTTGVACVLTDRSFIGIEKDPEYFKIASRRISEAQAKQQSTLFAN
jgi:site-specific DNA-methyltransferase (adenine-specific)